MPSVYSYNHVRICKISLPTVPLYKPMLVSIVFPLESGNLHVSRPVMGCKLDTCTRRVEKGSLSTVSRLLSVTWILPSGRTSSPTPDSVEFEKQ